VPSALDDSDLARVNRAGAQIRRQRRRGAAGDWRAPAQAPGVVDAAMEMADRLVHTQYDFLRHVVQSAGKTLTRQDEAKK
jgi:hypothetical protein